MNWEAIGAIGEILAAVTVLVSVVYLAIQVKSLKEQNSAAAHQHISNSMNAFAMLVAESETLGGILAKGRASYESLSEEERLRFDFLHYYVFNIMESWYMQIDQMVSIRGDKELMLANIKSIINVIGNHPGVIVFWENNRQHYPPELNEIFEEVT